MFVVAEVRLTVSFPVARASLMRLARAGLLRRLSGDAYADGAADVFRVGPVPGVSRLVKVRFAELVDHDDFAALPMRWEAAGAGGSLFPALDADITVTPDGPDGALLSVRGAYRPPLGVVGAGADRVLLHRVAEATVGMFARQVGAAISADSVVPETQGNLPGPALPLPATRLRAQLSRWKRHAGRGHRGTMRARQRPG